MGTLSEPDVVLPAPDGEVVPALEAGTGVVRDFVADKPRLGKRGAGGIDLSERHVIGRQGQPPSSNLEVEASLRFVDQGVDAAVVEPERRGARERGAPRFGRRAGPTRDQVDARVREACRAHSAERRLGFGCRVKPPHRLQDIIVKALHTHRNAIDTTLLQHFQNFWPGVQGVEFNREFGGWSLAAAQERGPPVWRAAILAAVATSCDPPVGAEGIKYGSQVTEGGGSASEIDG